jgi:hypothetical protein
MSTAPPALAPAAEIHRDLLDELLGEVREYAPDADVDRVRAAFELSCLHHDGQLRQSGEPFVHHPWSVARICGQLRQPEDVIIAALLHDVVEDTEATAEQIEERFGRDVRVLVEGVTKLSKIQFSSREEAEAENYRKMILSMAEDIRVIVIKLADRLHNMRTLSALGKQKQQQKARETLEVYAPLAHRLGIHSMKWELEDLAFATLYPRKYGEIQAMVNERRADRERFVTEAGEQLMVELDRVGIRASISGRAKHFYSIYEKMSRRGKEFNEIYDLTAMRVTVDSDRDCYGTIGVIHALWKPLPGRFKDYIAVPKTNGYQSLHTTVIGPHGKPLEIQVRTPQMHQRAEYGVAAHWLYKERSAVGTQWLEDLVDVADGDAGGYLDDLRAGLLGDEVYVFTPKGELKALGAGATPLDFAYAVHTDIGHRCVGAKVNGRIVPLHAALRRHRRGPHVEGRTRTVARLARRGRHHPRAQQDPRVVRARAARGHRAARTRHAPAGPPAEQPADPAHRLLVDGGHGHARDGLPQGRGLLRGDRRREHHRAAGHRAADPAAQGRRGHRGADDHAARRPARSRARVGHLRHRGGRPRGQGRRGAHGQVLHPRARGSDRRVRLRRAGHHDPPGELPELPAAAAQSGALHPRRLER